MARTLISDEFWLHIEPLFPKRDPPSELGGRPPIPDRAALTGILFVLKTGIPWEDLPQEMNCGCGMTYWRRLRDWQEVRVWQQLHEVLHAELRAADEIDWSLAAVDSSTIRAVCGGEETGPNPTDRRNLGSKRLVVFAGHGVPLEVQLTGANRHDVMQLIPMVANLPDVRGKVGHPQSRPQRSMAIEPTTRSPRAPFSNGLGSSRFSRSVGPRAAVDWENLIRRRAHHQLAAPTTAASCTI